jgi:endonuclease III
VPRSRLPNPDPPAGRRRPRTAAGRAKLVHEILAQDHPGTAVDLCELDHRNPFELLVATILSAQCTDERVNMTTPEVFRRWPDAEALAGSDTAELEEVIHPTGFFRQKAKSLQGMSRRLLDEHGGEVPHSLKDLVALPGVGRKTANVIRSVALDEPGLPVDTHVGRLAIRLGLTEETDPVKVELALNPMIPAGERGLFSLRTILHGRRICTARRAACGDCSLAWFCPSFGVTELPTSPHKKQKSR